jgi:hypothetical protein
VFAASQKHQCLWTNQAVSVRDDSEARHGSGLCRLTFEFTAGNIRRSQLLNVGCNEGLDGAIPAQD